MLPCCWTLPGQTRGSIDVVRAGYCIRAGHGLDVWPEVSSCWRVCLSRLASWNTPGPAAKMMDCAVAPAVSGPVERVHVHTAAADERSGEGLGDSGVAPPTRGAAA